MLLGKENNTKEKKLETVEERYERKGKEIRMSDERRKEMKKRKEKRNAHKT